MRTATNSSSIPQSLPAVRPQQLPQQPQHPPDITQLHNQLHETQSSFAAHVEKIHELEGVLVGREAIKREIGVEGVVEGKAHADADAAVETRRDGGGGVEGDDVAVFHHPHHLPYHPQRHISHHVLNLDDEDDDKGSVRKVVPHELERVEERMTISWRLLLLRVTMTKGRGRKGKGRRRGGEGERNLGGRGRLNRLAFGWITPLHLTLPLPMTAPRHHHRVSDVGRPLPHLVHHHRRHKRVVNEA